MRFSEPATSNGRALIISGDTWSVVTLPSETVLASGAVTVSDIRRVAIVDDGVSYRVVLDGIQVARLEPTPAEYDTVALGVGTGDGSTGSGLTVTFLNPTLELRPLSL